MALIDDLLPVAFNARGIAGTLGARPHTVTIVIRHYAGQHTGEEPISEERIQILEGDGQSPRVSQMKTEEIALGGFPPGTLKIGAITPEFDGGGTSDESLFGALPNGSTRHIEVAGPLAAPRTTLLCRIVGSNRDKPLRRILFVCPESAE